MTDIVLIVTIVVFFVAAALLVRVLDRMIASAGTDADARDQVSAPDVEPGGLT
jgi:hypothetical protein